ncbi:MAG: hypothetical protein ACI9EF_003970 [Pseudohongiellaceae bacterium]|jgi:hypothetical protein
MKNNFWRAASLALTTTLILVVASWASAQDRGDGDLVAPKGEVVIERDLFRYQITFGAVSSAENDKYILYDTWDVGNTKDIWFLEDPHKVRSSWKRMSFDKK